MPNMLWGSKTPGRMCVSPLQPPLSHGLPPPVDVQVSHLPSLSRECRVLHYLIRGCDDKETKAQEIAKLQNSLQNMQNMVDEANAMIVKDLQTAEKAINRATPMVPETQVFIESNENLNALRAEVENLKSQGKLYVWVKLSVQYFMDNLLSQTPDQQQTLTAIGENLFAMTIDQPFHFPSTLYGHFLHLKSERTVMKATTQQMATLYTVIGGTLLHIGVTFCNQGSKMIANRSYVGAALEVVVLCVLISNIMQERAWVALSFCHLMKGIRRSKCLKLVLRNEDNHEMEL